jgi:hypothetical protein
MLRALALLLVVAAAACGGDDGPTCVQVSTDCTPLYEPTFTNLFDRTFQPTCGVAGGSCHSAEGHKAGLVFADVDQAYDLLLGTDGRARVTPGDPGCSLLVERTESEDPGFQMPPRDPLDEATRCTIRQWIANGADR